MLASVENDSQFSGIKRELAEVLLSEESYFHRKAELAQSSLMSPAPMAESASTLSPQNRTSVTALKKRSPKLSFT